MQVYCDACGNKFFDHEFQWVRKISDDIWSGNPNATIIVYPRYFVDAEVPVLGVPGSRHELDPRWTLFFTPHSITSTKNLFPKPRAASGGTIDGIPQTGGRAAKCSDRTGGGSRGYIPYLETFSYVATEPEAGQPWLHGRRHVPLGMGWLASTQHPYRELPIKIQHSAYRCFSAIQTRVTSSSAEIGREYFDDRVDEQNIDDLLAIQDIFALERTWYQPSPIVCIERCRLKDAGGLTPETRKLYLDRLNKLKEIAERHEHSEHTTEREMCHLIDWVLKQWDPEAIQLLTTE